MTFPTATALTGHRINVRAVSNTKSLYFSCRSGHQRNDHSVHTPSGSIRSQTGSGLTCHLASTMSAFKEEHVVTLRSLRRPLCLIFLETFGLSTSPGVQLSKQASQVPLGKAEGSHYYIHVLQVVRSWGPGLPLVSGFWT